MAQFNSDQLRLMESERLAESTIDVDRLDDDLAGFAELQAQGIEEAIAFMRKTFAEERVTFPDDAE
jgi:hypothetical protein